MLKRIFCMLGLFVLIFSVTLVVVAQTAAQGTPVQVRGRLNVLWGDGSQENPGSTMHYYLTTENHETIPLLIENVSLDLTSLLYQQVRVTGYWLHDPDSGRPATLAANNVVIEWGGRIISGYSDVIGTKPWVTIRCKYAGYDAEPKDQEYYENMYSTGYPGLNHFWSEQSFGMVNVEGFVTDGWYQLPHDPEYYLPPEGRPVTIGTLEVLAIDCILAANADVDFSQYYGVMMMFNADPYSSAFGTLTDDFCLDGVCRDWGLTWIPPWGIENIGIIEHEMGHAFGLLHSSGEYGETYDNTWDLMSGVWNNIHNGAIDPVYGGMGQHTIYYHKHHLGWVADTQAALIRTGNSRTLTLERLALPQSGNYLGAKVLIDNNPIRFLTVEVRQQVGYDFWLPSVEGWNQSIIIHDVDVNRAVQAHVIDIDYNGETGDAGAMWLPGEVYFNPTYGIRITIVAATPTGFIVTIQNRFDGVGFNGSE